VSHYYLVASLPSLTLGDSLPIAEDEILDRCSRFLAAAEMDELRRILAGRYDECVTPFALKWLRAETQLRNAAARARAALRGVESAPYVKPNAGFDVALEKTVADAFSKSNPLEKEMELDRFRWRLLDDLVFAEAFEFSAVLAYALRLRMAARWARLTEDAGWTKLEENLAIFRTMEKAAEKFR
jgi:hypothetical protein